MLENNLNLSIFAEVIGAIVVVLAAILHIAIHGFLMRYGIAKFRYLLLAQLISIGLILILMFCFTDFYQDQKSMSYGFIYLLVFWGGIFSYNKKWGEEKTDVWSEKLRQKLYLKMMSDEALDKRFANVKSASEAECLNNWLTYGTRHRNMRILWGDYKSFRADLLSYFARRKVKDFNFEILVLLEINGFNVE